MVQNLASPDYQGELTALTVYCLTISQSFLGVVSNLLKLLH